MFNVCFIYIYIYICNICNIYIYIYYKYIYIYIYSLIHSELILTLILVDNFFSNMIIINK